MFVGMFGADIGVKLPTADLDALRTAGGGPFGPAERPMSGYITLPSTLDDAAAHGWVAKALDYVAGFPPKAKKTPKKR
jgi:hypothetical protein